jgi:hypothetical protein
MSSASEKPMIRLPQDAPRSLLVLTVLAVCVGLYGRFIGLGLWPFGVDEFYISRSIDNILRTGLPEFMCGGYYTRGIIYQYVVSGLRITGVMPEMAGRIVSAISSVGAFPAVYLLGKRLRGPVAGLLAVCILALSIWEIEMARFARMYAPFQTVFLWYLVFFFRYTVDHERRALAPMILLSFLGVALWEGGALMGVVNLLPPFINHESGRLRQRSWIYLIGMGAVLALLYLSTLDLRGFADLPPGYVESGVGAPQANWLFQTLTRHSTWLAAFSIPLAAGVANLKWIRQMWPRWLTVLGLIASLTAMLLHQFALVIGLIILLLLGRFVDWRELTSRSALYFWATLIASAAFWIALGHFAEPGLGAKFPLLVQQLLGFPDVLEKIARPWARSIPRTGAVLALALGGMVLRTILRPTEQTSNDRSLLIVAVAVILVVGAASMERLETRYTFFLYPVLLLVGISAVSTLIDSRVHAKSIAQACTCLIVIVAFVATDDFKPHHLLTIDTAATNFRHGMGPFERDHYYPRNDIRGTADWLRNHVHPGDLVFSSVPSLVAYYAHIDSFFLDDNDPRYEAYVCNHGSSERWSNLPLVYSSATLQQHVKRGQQIFLVNYHNQGAPALTDESIQIRQAWSSEDQGTDIYVLAR